MAVSCQTIVSLIEKLAPRRIAEDWDNIGLQIGSPAQEVNKIFVSLDINEEVLQEALDFGAEMIILHHTPIFKPLKRIRTDEASGKLIARIVQNNVALYTAHTNLDAAWGGVNDVLAEMLGLQEVAPLATSWQQKLYKLVVYVPHNYVEQVHRALTHAGAGCIGNYSECTFRVAGTGTFLPLPGSTPFLGQQGKLEYAQETRLETIIPEEHLAKTLKAMLKAHPYEEVAYDLYTLNNEGVKTGLGRVGYLPQPVTLAELIDIIKEKLQITNLRYCGDPEKTIKKLALCGGSGMSLVPQAIFSGAQLLLTGDIKYHEAQEALAQDMALIDAGHFATERPIIDVVADYLRKEKALKNVEIKVSQINTDPFRYA